MTLERVPQTAGAATIFRRTLDLGALGLEAGDELYFHALVTDRRMPVPNQAL